MSKTPTMAIQSTSQAADSPDAPATGFAFLPEVAQCLVVLSWASTFILTKDAFDSFRPLAFVVVRFTIIVAICLGVLAVQGARSGWRRYWHVDREDWPRFILAGVSGYTVYQLGFTLGLVHTSPFSSSLLISMMPLFVLLLVTVLGERPSTSAWIGVGIAIAGVVVFLADRSAGGSWLGNALALMASMSFATFGIVSRPLVRKYPTETFSAMATVIGALPLVVIGLPDTIAQDWGSLPASAWWVMLYMSVLPVYVAYMIWNWAIGVRGVSATGWSLLVPIVSGVLSALFYDEAFGVLKIGGAGLAILGLVFMRRNPARSRVRIGGRAIV